MPGYLGNDPSGSATKIARQTYTTSGAATTDFTFTSGYDVGYLDVYVNGERQTKGKNFTASDGSTFKVLNGGVGTGSTVEAIAYKTFNLATVDFDDLGNTGNLTLSGDISAVNATFSGDVSIGGTLTYEDVTNIDSVGVITARLGVDIITGGIDIVGNTTGLNVSGVGTFTGDVSIADKIIHTDDTNTAIRFPAADTFTVETSGAEALRVQSDGDVGIGTIDNSNNERLRVQDDATTSTVCQLSIISGNAERAVLNFGDKDDANIGRVTYDNRDNHLSLFTSNSEALRVTSGGDVGIGTTIPATGSKLHLHDTTACRIHLTTDSTGHTSSDGTRLMIDSSNNFEILNKENTNIEFFTNNFERVRITGIGSVGIATATPFQSILHVCDSTSYQGIFINGSGAPRINFARAATTTVEWGVGIDGTNGNRFAIAQAGNTAKLVIDTSGNVNITGITTATQLFEGTNRVATAGKAVAMALVFG